MIVLAGPACNYVLKFLHLAGRSFYSLNCQVHPPVTKNLPVNSLNIICASKPRESTSSFSFFRQFCKLFTFKCSCRSLSRSPVFSLLASSSCSYDNRTTWTWALNMIFSIDKQLWRSSVLLKHVINIFQYNINKEGLLGLNVTVLLVECWCAAGSPHCSWTSAVPLPCFPGSADPCDAAESGHTCNLAQP